MLKSKWIKKERKTDRQTSMFSWSFPVIEIDLMEIIVKLH